MADSRPAGTYVVPFKKEVDGLTGHTSWYVRVEVVDENGNEMHGPPVIHGVSLEVLDLKHGGSHGRFLQEHVKPDMLKRHDAMKRSHAEAESLVGKPL